MKKLFLLIIIAGIGFSGYIIFKNLASRDIKLELTTTEDTVKYGEPFDIEIFFANDSGNDLVNTRLVVNLPEHIILVEDEGSNISRELGEIKIGGIHRERISVVAVPGENPDYKIVANVFYSPSSLVAEFKKKSEIEIKIEDLKFDLELSAPERIFRGEKFEIKASYESEEKLEELSGITLRFDLPEKFVKTDENPESQGDNIWGLHKSGAGEVIINGVLETSKDNNFDVIANLVMEILGENYVFLSSSMNILVEPSPLSLNVVLGEQDSVAIPGERIIYVLRYRNNTNVTLLDVVIRAQLIGVMFDINTIESQSSFNKSNSTITWTARNIDGLRALRPNESGEVSFSIKTKDIHPIGRLNDKNFIVRVKAEIESPTVPSQINTDRTINTAEIETNVAGLVSIDAIAFFRDPSTGIINNGPFPPRVGSKTNFTVHWKISNFGTDVSGAEIRTRLSPGVRFVKIVSNNTEINPEYDESSKEIVWKIGDLLATTGVISEKPEVVFQIEATPTNQNVGEYMRLLGETRVSARDLFTGRTISSITSPITTRLSGDGSVSESSGRVVD